VNSFKAEFDRRGLTIIVISFAQPATLIRYQEYHHWPFVILADPDRVVYQAFNLERLSLWRVFSLSTLRLYFTLLHQGKRIRSFGEKEDYYQSGGDFLIDGDGNILFAHRSQDPSDRPPLTSLLQQVDRLRQ
jgi:peroxiredoxin